MKDIKKIKEKERAFREKDLPFEVFTVKTKTKWWSQIELQNVLNYLKIKGKEYILDVGCSDGRFLGYLNKKFPEIKLFGVDFARNPLKTLLAKEFKSYPVCNEITQLSFKFNSFDCAVSIQVIQQLPSREERIKVLKSIHGVLKDKGSLVITVLNQNSWSHMAANGKEGPLIGAKDLHVYLYDSIDLREELEVGGFRVDTIVGINNFPVRYLKKLGVAAVFMDIAITKLLKKFSLNRGCYLLASCRKN